MESSARLRIEGLTSRHVGPLDLALAPGTCTTVSGPSGAGKTLLLRAIADLDPSGGNVFLDGIAREDMAAPAWRRRVGMLPAESAWWSDTVRGSMPAPDLAWMERIGFGPEVLEWQVSRLSTGERQRLALIRLLANRPAALLLDEPTANLDADNTHRVEGLLAEYLHRREAACLWVTHDAAQVSRVSARHVILFEGKLCEACGPNGSGEAP